MRCEIVRMGFDWRWGEKFQHRDIASGEIVQMVLIEDEVKTFKFRRVASVRESWWWEASLLCLYISLSLLHPQLASLFLIWSSSGILETSRLRKQGRTSSIQKYSPQSQHWKLSLWVSLHCTTEHGQQWAQDMRNASEPLQVPHDSLPVVLESLCSGRCHGGLVNHATFLLHMSTW